MQSWLTNSTAVTGHRWDHGYQAFQQQAFLQRWSKQHELASLGEIIQDDSYGILTPGNVYSSEHPITYVRVTDMRDGMEIDYEQTLQVPEEYYRHKRARLRKHDILLAVKGASIASSKSVAFINDDPSCKTIVNGTIFRFQVKKPHNPLYVAVMLDSEILKGQIRSLQVSNNAVSYVDKPSIHALHIPLPPRPIQDRIAHMMQDAYAARRDKLAEAETLLDEIDDYVLERLGIALDERSRKQHFVVKSSLLIGHRFDVGPYANEFNLQEESSFAWVQLQEIAQLPRETKLPGKTPDAEYFYVGMRSVDDVMAEVNIQRLLGREIKANKTVFRGGDVVFARIEPCIYNRKIASIPYEVKEALGSTELLVARARQGVLPEYLLWILRSELIQRQIAGRMTGTTGRRRLPPRVFARLKVPIVQLELQGEIAEGAAKRRDGAKELQQEAKSVVADAKARVERMILGREAVQ